MLSHAGPRLPTRKGRKKLRQSHQTAAAVFLHAKLSSCPKHRKQMGDIHLSRSPDWRINSTCTSLLSFPMTDFRPVQAPPRLQWRYRSGFTPDSLFSTGTNQVHRRHLNVYFLFSQQNTIFPALCQGNFRKRLQLAAANLPPNTQGPQHPEKKNPNLSP